MVYRKGERSKAQLQRDYLHQVVIAVPPDGLGKRTGAISAALVEIAPAGHAHWSELRGLDFRVVYGFDRPEHAEAFRRFAAERWPELLDVAQIKPLVREPWKVKRAP